MIEILDEIEVNNTRKTFSKLSLISALITLGLFSYLFLMTPSTIKVGDMFSRSPMAIYVGVPLFCVSGMILMVLSFVEKEPTSWVKWTGAIINILLFWTVVGFAILARIA